MSELHRSTCLVVIVVSLCGLAPAQTTDNIPTFATVEDHGIDAINLQNLDVLIQPQVRSKAGAIPTQFGLLGTSSCTLSFSDVQSLYCGLASIGVLAITDLNFRLVETSGASSPFGGGPLLLSARSTVSTSAFCSNGMSTTKKSSWVITDARGSHALPSSDFVDSAQCLAGSLTDRTLDSSGYTLAVTGGGSAYTVYASDGSWSTGNSGITDSNGNTISVNTSVSPHTVTDTLNTVALTYQPVAAGASGGTYSWTDINGNTQTIRQTFTTLTINNDFGCPGYGFRTVTGIDAVTGVSYPDGAIGLAYEPNPLHAGTYTGRIRQITYKTGGTVTYGYSGGSNGIDCNWSLPPQMTRTTQDGTTTYTWVSVNSNRGNTTTVVDPGKNKTVYTFSGIYLTQVQTYRNTGTVSSPVYTLLTTDTICYNATSSGCQTAVVSSPITEKDVYHTIAGMSGSSRTQIKYDGYGNVTSDAKYDFGASTFTYKSTTMYGSWNGSTCASIGSNINNHPCDVLTTDGTNTLAETRFTYDVHGNLTTKSRWTGGRWLNNSATYNPNGTVGTSTDVNGTPTTYSYAATGSGGCNRLLLTGTQTVVSTGYTLTTSKTWDSACNGAVPVTSTDANGNITNYGYNDPYFRPTSITDPLGYVNALSYTPTSASSSASFNSSVDNGTTYLDGLGRPSLAQKQEGPGSSNYDSVSTSYAWNGTSFQTGKSQPCVQTQDAGCASYFTYSTVDPLGRLLSMQDAGGGTVIDSYSQNDVKITVGPAPAGENTKSLQTEYDGLGRPKSTCQILASGGSSCGQSTAASGYLTSYSYSTLPGATKTIIARGVQTRTAIYDALSRPTSQTTPESGTVNSIYDTVASCGPNGPYTSSGDLVMVTDARGFSACHSYDSLHRVTDVSNSAESSTNACKRFRYDNSTGVLGSIPTGVTVSNPLGRLVEAETDSCASPITQSSMITDEWFSYDKDGRLTDVYELTPHSGGYYHTTVSYTPNGALSSLSGIPGYPAMTYGLDGEGRLSTALHGTTKVVCDPSCSSASTTYNAAGQPLTINVGGFADSDTYTYDPATGRMTNYTFSVNSISESGAITWNANGSLSKLVINDGFNSGGTQTCKYGDPLGSPTVPGYDDLGQLLTVNCLNASNTNVWNQNFAYDLFGNVTKQVPTGGTGINWNPGYNSANNQYATSSGATYDASGNLLYDTLNSYTWNSYGKMASVITGRGAVTCGTSGVCVTYDAMGRAVEKSNNTNYVEILYSPLGKTAIMSGQIATSSYIPLPGGATEFENNSNGSGHHLWHKDWLGSVRLSSSVVNRSMVADRAFAPFGEAYNSLGASNELSFTGDTQDVFSASPGLYDTANRELQTTQGRWISPDPAGAGWNPYAYVRNSPMSFTDPSGLCVGAACSCVGGGCPRGHRRVEAENGIPDGVGYYVDGIEMPGDLVAGLLGMGAAAQCPNNICDGVNSRGQFVQYYAFANSGGYYAYSGPGALYFSLESAGLAAANYLRGQFSPDFAHDMHEYASNVYEDTASSVFSYTPAQQSQECQYGESCDVTFDFGAPDGMLLVGFAHTHPQIGYGDTEFSGEVGDHGDISTFTRFTPQLFGFLVTSPGDRVLMFNPIAFAGWPGNNSNPICVLQGDKQGVPSCH